MARANEVLLKERCEADRFFLQVSPKNRRARHGGRAPSRLAWRQALEGYTIFSRQTSSKKIEAAKPALKENLHKNAKLN